MNNWIKLIYIAHCKYGVRLPLINKYSSSTVNIIYMEALNNGVNIKLQSKKIIEKILRYKR